MARDGIDSTYISSSVATIRPEMAVCLDFKPTGSEDAYVRLWSGITSASFNDFSGAGKTYFGIGTLGQITAIPETSEVAAKGIELTLSSVPSDYAALALRNNYRGRTAAIYLMLYNEDRSAYQQTTIFRGRMDQLTIQEGEKTSTLSLKIESRLIDLQRPIERRYTDEYQKSMINPNDSGLEFIYTMADKLIYWGMDAPKSTISSGGGDGGGGGGSGDGTMITPP